MGWIDVFDVKEFRNDSKKKAKGKENQQKIVQLFHRFIVRNFIFYNHKNYKTDPEKAPEDK